MNLDKQGITLLNDFIRHQNDLLGSKKVGGALYGGNIWNEYLKSRDRVISYNLFKKGAKKKKKLTKITKELEKISDDHKKILKDHKKLSAKEKDEHVQEDFTTIKKGQRTTRIAKPKKKGKGKYMKLGLLGNGAKTPEEARALALWSDDYFNRFNTRPDDWQIEQFLRMFRRRHMRLRRSKAPPRRRRRRRDDDDKDPPGYKRFGMPIGKGMDRDKTKLKAFLDENNVSRQDEEHMMRIIRGLQHVDGIPLEDIDLDDVLEVVQGIIIPGPGASQREINRFTRLFDLDQMGFGIGAKKKAKKSKSKKSEDPFNMTAKERKIMKAWERRFVNSRAWKEIGKTSMNRDDVERMLEAIRHRRLGQEEAFLDV